MIPGIEIDLTYGDAEPATEIELLDTMKIRVNPTKLVVDDRNGFTYVVDGDIQDMFFRANEDSTRWTLLEWRDIPSGGGVGAPGRGSQPLSGDAAPGGNTRHVSWGELIATLDRTRQ